MDDELVPAVEPQHHEFQQSAAGIESEPKLTGCAVIVEIFHSQRPRRGLDRIIGIDSMFERGSTNPHSANAA